MRPLSVQIGETLQNYKRGILGVVFVALAFTLSTTSAAQGDSANASVRVRGSGAETWVLLTGIVGGTAGMRQMEQLLVLRGLRVVTIDAYALSIDSEDVSFAALARRVDAQLNELHVNHARVVGHSHGGGVALRLAASYPNRVASLELLDVGALAVNKTKVMGRSLALLPMLAHVPGVRGLVRRKIIDGVRDNSGRAEWFDAAAEHSYTDWVFSDLDRVMVMMQRLGRAREPESLSSVVARVQVPVTVLIGDAPHQSGAGSEEIAAFNSLNAQFRVLHLAGIGHFPHEEAPELLIRTIEMPTVAVAMQVSR